MNGKRVIAGIIDYVIAGFIQTVLMMLFFIIPLQNNKLASGDLDILFRMMTITYCSMGFLIIRDIIGKRSLGKIIMKLKIVIKKNEKDASFVKRLLRNLTWILGPVDIIVFLITQERLGDKIIGTKVVEK